MPSAAERVELSRRSEPASPSLPGASAPLVINVTAALGLVLTTYVSERTLLQVANTFAPELYSPHLRELAKLVGWALLRVCGFFVLPMAVIVLSLREPLRSFGAGWGDLTRHLSTYVGLYALMLPLLTLASGEPAFVELYPFYRRAGESWLELLSWELAYGLQFVALEFFFRGFLTLGLVRAFGQQALYFALVPYCMLHFHKPLAEALGAIAAGLVLGQLALRTRSIWGGVILHVAVAWSLDLAILLRSSGLPSRWLP